MKLCGKLPLELRTRLEKDRERERERESRGTHYILASPRAGCMGSG